MTANTPLRVLIVHNWYRSEIPSGEDRVVEQEMELLKSGGHTVSLFGRRSDDIASMPARERVMVPLQVPWNRAVRAELARVLRRTRPDIVHVHSTFPLLSPSVLAACADVDVPVVATLHNYGLVCATGTMLRNGTSCTACVPTRSAAAVVHGCYRGSRVASLPVAVGMVVNRTRWLRAVTQFFCISAAQRDLLVEAGVPADRLAVKHNFVPEPHVRRDGVGEHILFVGRLTEEKGLRLLMAAWDRLATSESPAVPLVVAGSGPLAGELQVWGAGRSDVAALGLQTRQECAELVAKAMAVVVPSVWPEAFGLVAVEAMAAGVPVIAAGQGALRELVEDGVTGLTHQPGDVASLAERLARLIAAPEENVAFGRAGRRRYERDFAPDVGLAVLVAGYRSAMVRGSA